MKISIFESIFLCHLQPDAKPNIVIYKELKRRPNRELDVFM